MKTLVMTDIHANEPALKAVLSEAFPCDRIVFLGDLANFGPHPKLCVEILKQIKPICIIGNHDEQIVSPEPKHYWDKWAKKQLAEDDLTWMSTFEESLVLDGHILLVHGSYSVNYDILPNTPDENIKAAFENLLSEEIDQVWFGHYHYQIDRVIEGVEYHCIRPVGHHRDGDIRAGYSVYENGVLTHNRVPYELSKTINDFQELDIFEENETKERFVELLENAFQKDLLKKDLQQMEENERMSK